MSFFRREAVPPPPPDEDPPPRIQAAFAFLDSCKDWTDPIEIGGSGLYFARSLDDNQQIVRHVALDAIGDYIAGHRSFHSVEGQR